MTHSLTGHKWPNFLKSAAFVFASRINAMSVAVSKEQANQNLVLFTQISGGFEDWPKVIFRWQRRKTKEFMSQFFHAKRLFSSNCSGNSYFNYQSGTKIESWCVNGWEVMRVSVDPNFELQNRCTSSHWYSWSGSTAAICKEIFAWSIYWILVLPECDDGVNFAFWPALFTLLVPLRWTPIFLNSTQFSTGDHIWNHPIW